MCTQAAEREGAGLVVEPAANHCPSRVQQGLQAAPVATLASTLEYGVAVGEQVGILALVVEEAHLMVMALLVVVVAGAAVVAVVQAAV